MLKVDINKTNTSTVVRLSGVIDESVDFSKVLVNLPQSFILNCKGVTKINSNGVKSWIIYFASLARNGHTFSFQEMSIPLVEQLNSLANFSCGAKVESIESPYLCTNSACRKEVKVIHDVSQIKTGEDPSPVKCPHCGSMAEFDDLSDEYFSFLECA